MPAASGARAAGSAAAASSAVAPSRASAGSTATGPTDPRAACAALQGSLAESAAGLKLDGAVVDSATLVQAGGSAVCKVTGSATLAEGSGAPIRFQASLPSEWNRHAIQFQGGMDAGQPLLDRDAAVADGYIIYGQAGGGGAERNAQADARAVVVQKKLYDITQELMARRFQRLSDRVYLVTGPADGIALELVKQHPYAFRGVLADLSNGAHADEQKPGAAADQPAAALNKETAAKDLASYVNVGGKLMLLVPAGYAATLFTLGQPATAPAPATEAPLLMGYRDLYERAGTRYTQAAMWLYSMPAGEPRAADKEKVDWIAALRDWAEDGKTPPALAQLPAHR